MPEHYDLALDMLFAMCSNNHLTGCRIWGGRSWREPILKRWGPTGPNTYNVRVRVIVWEETYGPVPEGKAVRNACGTQNCISPGHLELVDIEKELDEDGKFRYHAVPKKKKVSGEKVREIIRRLKAGENIKDVAKAYHMPYTTVYNISRKWTHSAQWDLVEESDRLAALAEKRPPGTSG